MYLYSAFIVVPHTQGALAWTTQFHIQLYYACLYLVCVHQMAPLRQRLRTSNCSLLLIYLPRKDKRLSRPGWTVYPHKWSSISCRSSVGQGKFAGQRSITAPRKQRNTAKARQRAKKKKAASFNSYIRRK